MNLGPVTGASLLLQGCVNAPSINVIGAYFPDWLFCWVAAGLLTLLCHLWLAKRQWTQWLSPVALCYPLLTAIFAFATWLVFFQF